jgi:integrase
MGVKIRQKKKGKGNPWWVFITHNKQRTSMKVGTKQAAQAVADEVAAELKLGKFDMNRKKEKPVSTFKEYSEIFMDGYSKNKHKKSTRDSYRNVLDLHLLPEFGSMPLSEIKRKNIKDMIYKKQDSGLSAGSVRIMKAYASSIMSQAVDDEIIHVNPVSHTGKDIKRDDTQKEISPFSWEEKAAFEEAIQKHFPRYYPLFLCALRTGMREGELIALKPGDLDFNGGFIEVKRNYVRGDITTPKNGKTRRVDMSDQLSAELEAHLTQRKRETLKKGWTEIPEWLFYNEDGKMVDVSNLRKRGYYKCLEKSGIRRITLHQLRHTYATLRIQTGHNIADVSKQLGHSSIKITVDTYFHYIPGTSSTEVNDLDQNTAPKCTPYAPSHDFTNKKRLAELS